MQMHVCRAKKGASQGVKAPVVTFRDVAGVDSVKVLLFISIYCPVGPMADNT